MRRGFTFAEIIVAVLIAAMCAAPIVYMTMSSRKETSKAINYLRALELANEAIEWASLSSFEELEKLQNGQGSLQEQSGSGFTPVKVNLKPPENQDWVTEEVVADQIRYSEQYLNAFFFREVAVEEIGAGNGIDAGHLKKVTVTVLWNEGQVPEQLFDAKRMRKITLSTLVGNDKKLDY